MSLEFSESGHVYKKDGVQVPHVTEVVDILGSIYDPIVNGLKKAMNIEDDAERVKAIRAVCGWTPKYLGNVRRAAELGGYVHQAIQWYESGTLDMESLHPEVQNRLNAWIQFRVENPIGLNMDNLTFEQMVYLDVGVAGRFDVFDGEKLVEIKTCDERPTHKIQTEAYVRGNFRGPQYILYLDKKGGFKPIPVNKKKSDQADSWNYFMSALNVLRFKKKHGGIE